MYLTIEKVNKELELTRLLIKKYDLKLANARVNQSSAPKIFKWFYQMDIEDYYSYLKTLKTRERTLVILKSFPDLIPNVKLSDYRDNSKLYLILHQHDCINRFCEIETNLHKLSAEIEQLKIKIK